MTGDISVNRSANAPELKVSGIGKTFGVTTVLRDIDLTIRSGEFVGLMGPNGAGKSTLIKILDGVYTASTGEIRIGGERVSSLRNSREVGFVHQDLGLIDSLSVMENLRLGAEPLRRFGVLLDGRAEREWAERALENIGLNISPTALVSELAPGEKTLVAVARVFVRGARVIFVDEATSTLPPSEAKGVIDTLLAIAKGGASVIMVSHKLSEILNATSRIIILIDGKLVRDETTSGVNRSDLVGMLLQHEAARAEEVAGHDSPSATAQGGGEVVLEMTGVCGGRAGPLDLALRGGEVTGVTGLTGSGLHDVAFLAHGSMRPTSGKLVRRPRLRVALVPPYRETQGGFPALDVRTNLTVSALRRWTLLRPFLRVGREATDSEEMVGRLDVRPARIDNEFGVLSGGNKQKVIFGRSLFQHPDLYVLCEPTRGVDVGTRSAIYGLIRELRADGAAVLIVSSDSEDLFAVCDGISVISDGRLSDVQPIANLDPAELEALV